MYKTQYMWYHTYGVILFFGMVLVGAVLPESFYAHADISNRMQGVSFQHILGTDIVGRDIFYNVVRASYNVAIIVVCSVVFGGIIGVGVGVFSPRFPKSLQHVIQGIMDMLFSFPMVLVALVLMGVYGSGKWVAIFALGVFFIPVFYRMTVGVSRPLWQADFVVSSRLSGVSIWRIGWGHIMPNAFPIIRANITVQCGIAVLAESGLGYLGLSTQNPEPTWGSMILDAQHILLINPSLALPVAGVISGFVALCFAMNTDTPTGKN